MQYADVSERLAGLLNDIRASVVQYGNHADDVAQAGLDDLARTAKSLASELEMPQLSDALGDLGTVLQEEPSSEGALVEALIAVDEASRVLDHRTAEDVKPSEADGSAAEADLQIELDDLLALPAFQIQLRKEAERRGELLLVIRVRVPLESRVGLLTQIEQYANVIRSVGVDGGSHLSLLCSFPDAGAAWSVLRQLRTVPHQLLHAGNDSSLINRTATTIGPSIDYETAERIGLVLDGIGAQIDTQPENGATSVRAHLSVLRSILSQRERRTLASIAVRALQNTEYPESGIKSFSSYGSWIRLLEPMATGIQDLIEAIAGEIRSTLPFQSARLLAGETGDIVRLRIMFDNVNRSWWKCLQAAINNATKEATPIGSTSPSIPEGCDRDHYQSVVKAVERLSGAMSARVYTKKGGKGVRVVGIELTNSADLRSVFLCQIEDRTVAVPRLYTQGPYEVGVSAVSEDRLGGRFVRVAGAVYPLSDLHSAKLPSTALGVVICRFPTKTTALLVDKVDGPRMVRTSVESFRVVRSLSGHSEYEYLV